MATQAELSIWMALLFLCGASTSALSAVTSANVYVDRLLAATVASSETLDSIRLPQFETNNRDRFLFINVKVKTSYSNGYLRNVDRITRLGDCLPESNVEAVKISCTVQFSGLRVDYKGRMKYGQLPKIGITAKATVRPVEAHVVITNSTVLPGALKLQSFELASPVEMDPAFTGIGLLNRYLKMLKGDFVDNVGLHVGQAIRREFVAALNRTLSDQSQS